jgi:hypothetical protein
MTWTTLRPATILRLIFRPIPLAIFLAAATLAVAIPFANLSSTAPLTTENLLRRSGPDATGVTTIWWSSAILSAVAGLLTGAFTKWNLGSDVAVVIPNLSRQIAVLQALLGITLALPATVLIASAGDNFFALTTFAMCIAVFAIAATGLVCDGAAFLASATFVLALAVGRPIIFETAARSAPLPFALITLSVAGALMWREALPSVWLTRRERFHRPISAHERGGFGARVRHWLFDAPIGAIYADRPQIFVRKSSSGLFHHVRAAIFEQAGLRRGQALGRALGIAVYFGVFTCILRLDPAFWPIATGVFYALGGTAQPLIANTLSRRDRARLALITSNAWLMSWAVVAILISYLILTLPAPLAPPRGSKVGFEPWLIALIVITWSAFLHWDGMSTLGRDRAQLKLRRVWVLIAGAAMYFAALVPTLGIVSAWLPVFGVVPIALALLTVAILLRVAQYFWLLRRFRASDL